MCHHSIVAKSATAVVYGMTRQLRSRTLKLKTFSSPSPFFHPISNNLCGPRSSRPLSLSSLALFSLFLSFFFSTMSAHAAAAAVLLASSADAFAPSTFQHSPAMLRSAVAPAARTKSVLKLSMDVSAPCPGGRLLSLSLSRT